VTEKEKEVNKVQKVPKQSWISIHNVMILPSLFLGKEEEVYIITGEHIRVREEDKEGNKGAII
jgi:hypothetical protein